MLASNEGFFDNAHDLVVGLRFERICSVSATFPAKLQPLGHIIIITGDDQNDWVWNTNKGSK